MFPLGINLHSNAAQYRPAPPPMQRRFTVGAQSAAFSVPSKPVLLQHYLHQNHQATIHITRNIVTPTISLKR